MSYVAKVTLSNLMPDNPLESSATRGSSAKYLAICSLLTTLLVSGGFLWFMTANPNRKGMITIGSADNPSIKIEVQDGENIEEVLLRTLNRTSDLEKIGLISKITHIIKTHKDLGLKVLESAEKGETPFWWGYRTVKLEPNEKLVTTSLSTCEDSDLRGQLIQIVISRKVKNDNPNDQEREKAVVARTNMLKALEVHPCMGREEIIQTNDPDFLQEMKKPGYTVTARRRIILPNGRAKDQAMVQTPMEKALTWLRNMLSTG